MPLFHTFEMLIRMELSVILNGLEHIPMSIPYLEICYIYFVACLRNVNFHSVACCLDLQTRPSILLYSGPFRTPLFRLLSKPFFLKVISAFNNTVFFFYQDLKKTCLYYLYAMVGMKYENSSMPKVSTTLQMHNTFIVQLFLNITVTLKIATLVIGASKS